MEPLFGSDGKPLWYRSPKHGRSGDLLTTKLATDTYIVVIQFGAIAAIALLYWSQLVSMVRGLLGRDPAGRRLLINIMIAFVPAAGIGFLAHDWIDENLFSVKTVIVAQVAGALLMFYAEYWYGKNLLAGTRVERSEISPLGAAGVGLLQCAALCPGTSRSMMTIVGGYFAGLDPRRSAEFSFILGFVTLTAASFYKSLSGGPAMIEVFGWPHVLLGGIVAAVTAAAAGDIIMVGPTATTWGPVTFPAQKELAVYGLSGASHSNTISVGAITFSPAVGTAQQNQLWLANLYVNGDFSGAQGVLFSGAAPGRLRMVGCFVSDSGTGNSIVSNNSGVGASFYVVDCLTDAGDAVPSPRLVYYTSQRQP